VPSGALFFVPWGALALAPAVVVLPTGGWLLRDPAPAGGNGSAVIVGDPAYGGAWPQLPGARQEAQAVADLYGSAPVTGAAASEEAIRSRLGDGADVLHLATHGRFVAAAPLQSAVILSNGQAAAPLTAAAIFARPLPARLVVLSACETGVGRSTAGEDFLGLVRSFYLGGARAVLNSLWPIEDEGTRTFMQSFHAAARRGDYAAAWQQARDETRAKGFPPSVYGAFILGGAAGGGR
jgi:CHAT domain-containing protein